MALSASPSQKGVFLLLASYVTTVGHIPSVLRVQGAQRMEGTVAVARERRMDLLPLSQGRVLEGATTDCSSLLSCPKLWEQERWRKKECTPSLGRMKSPKGPPRVSKPARPLVKGNRLGSPSDRRQSSSPWDSLAQWLPHLMQDPRWW